MVTRVRIEAQGATAAEVEAHLQCAADAVAGYLGESEPIKGEQFIERDQSEPEGYTAHKGRLLVYLNVASDSPQVVVLRRETGLCSVAPGPPDGPPGAERGL